MDDALPVELVDAARRVIDENRAKGRRVAVAESCTGGLVSAALTSISGSSDVFEVGFITYSNEAKMSALGVDSNILETFGAVSIATAWAMAQGTLDQIASAARLINGTVGTTGATAPVGRPAGTEAMASAPVERIHAVQEGDSLTRISSRYYGTPNRWQDIYEANRDILKGENALRPGQRLKIP